MPEGPLANSSIAQQTWQDLKGKHILSPSSDWKSGNRGMRFRRLAAAKRLFQSVLLSSDDVWSVIMASGIEESPSDPCHLVRKCHHYDVPVSPGRQLTQPASQG
jgi:hypothetical protein